MEASLRWPAVMRARSISRRAATAQYVDPPCDSSSGFMPTHECGARGKASLPWARGAHQYHASAKIHRPSRGDVIRTHSYVTHRLVLERAAQNERTFWHRRTRCSCGCSIRRGRNRRLTSRPECNSPANFSVLEACAPCGAERREARSRTGCSPRTRSTESACHSRSRPCAAGSFRLLAAVLASRSRSQSLHEPLACATSVSKHARLVQPRTLHALQVVTEDDKHEQRCVAASAHACLNRAELHRMGARRSPPHHAVWQVLLKPRVNGRLESVRHCEMPVVIVMR
jgi:hypothetical protein